MEAADMMKILKQQYNINNEEEFNMAVKKSVGIDIGIFTMPLRGRDNQNEERECA